MDLSDNNISNIKVLEKVKLEKLELLYLRYNNIDINKFSSIINNLKFKYYI